MLRVVVNPTFKAQAGAESPEAAACTASQPRPTPAS